MGEARGIYQRGDTKYIQNFGQKVCYFSASFYTQYCSEFTLAVMDHIQTHTPQL